MDERTWRRLMAPWRLRLANLLQRGVVALVDSSKDMQTIQGRVRAGTPQDWLEHFEPYGYTSRAHAGAEHLAAQVNANADHTVVVCVADRRYRLKGLVDGEVALYDDLGNVVQLKRDRVLVDAVQHLEVNAPTAQITATTTHIGNVTIDGDLTVSGQITGQGGMAISGGAGATIDGDMQISNGDVVADTISLKHHKTTLVQPGTGLSGDPQ